MSSCSAWRSTRRHAHETRTSSAGRRSLLRGLLGIGATEAALAVPRSALAGQVETTLVLDVACLGDIFRFIPAPVSPPLASLVYGSPFRCATLPAPHARGC